MSLQDRLFETEQKFESLKAQREEHLNKAKDMWDEMMRVQGEYRAIEEMIADGKASEILDGVKAKKATVIEAVPEEK